MGFQNKYKISHRIRRERERISKLENFLERERAILEERAHLKAPPLREKSAENAVWVWIGINPNSYIDKYRSSDSLSISISILNYLSLNLNPSRLALQYFIKDAGIVHNPFNNQAIRNDYVKYPHYSVKIKICSRKWLYRSSLRWRLSRN